VRLRAALGLTALALAWSLALNSTSPCSAWASAATPNGLIAFAGSPTQCGPVCDSRIYTVAANGSDLQLVTPGPLAGDPYFSASAVWSPVFSPSGDGLLFEGRYGLFTMNLDGSQVRQIFQSSPSGAAVSAARYSPDETRVVAVDATHRFLFTVAAAGGPVEPIPRSGQFLQPSFSPDGQHMLAVRQLRHPARTYDVVMNLDGSHRRRVPHSDGLIEPSYSADGNWIVGAGLIQEPRATASRPPRWGVFMVRTDGSHLHRVGRIASILQALEPVMSADGREIALTRYRGTSLRSEVLTMRIDGSHLRRISPRGVDSTHPSWQWLDE
jgi:Tol biopolymer transport system component